MKTSSYSWHCSCSPSLCQSSSSFLDEAAVHAIHDVHAINRILSPVIQNQTSYEHFFRLPLDYHPLQSFDFTCFVLLQTHEHNKLEPRSRICCFFGYGETQKGYRCYDPVSHHLCISYNVVFWEHRSFVKLYHFHTSLSTSPVLDLFPDEPHIPSIVTLDSSIDFFVQPPDIFDASPRFPLMNKWEMNRSKMSHPTLSLGPQLLLHLKILHKTFHLITQLG